MQTYTESEALIAAIHHQAMVLMDAEYEGELNSEGFEELIRLEGIYGPSWPVEFDVYMENMKRRARGAGANPLPHDVVDIPF